MSSSGSNWFKYGCFGCLGVITLVVMILGVIAGVAGMKVRSEEVAEETLTPEIPMSARALAGPDEDAATSPSEPVDGIPENVGRIVLELSGADFEVEPANPGESLHVEATYDRKMYRLEESMNEDDASNWTYTVRFERSSGGGMMAALKQMFGGTKPHVSIYLPPDVPMAVSLDIGEGGAELDLGGLWITSLDAEFNKGGVVLSFSEPTRVPLERLSFQGSMGGVVLRKLGNASPHRLDIELSMGGMDVDLAGQWRNDSDISLSQSMGGAALHLPHGVRVEGLEGHSTLDNSNAEISLPTLRFDVTGKIEIR